jgi:hypothetical protein
MIYEPNLSSSAEDSAPTGRNRHFLIRHGTVAAWLCILLTLVSVALLTIGIVAFVVI